MTIFVEPPLNPSPEAIVQLGITRMQEQYPNWNPNPSSPEYRMFLSFAAIACETIILAYNIPEEIIRFTGEIVYQEPPREAKQAEATSTWVAADAHGYEIEAGVKILITPAGGESVGFEVLESVLIPEGQIATASGGVKLRAINPGAASNGITGPVVTGELISWVSEIQVFTQSTGGSDAETTAEYARRIVELAQIVAPHPILPEDFAKFVRLKLIGVARSVAFDEYNAETNETGQERCVTVGIMSSTGENVSEVVLNEAKLLLKGAREASFKSFVINPTPHAINVTVVGKKVTGYEIVDVQERTKAALEVLLSPANWGVPQNGDTTSWINTPILRFQDIITTVNNVVGFDHYTELKLNGAEADVAMSGIFPVTTPGTLTVTIS